MLDLLSTSSEFEKQGEAGHSQAHAITNATESIKSIILDSQPSALQFSLLNTQYFVVGTYVLEAEPKVDPDGSSSARDEQLPKATQKRSGSLILFCLEESDL